MEKNRFEAFSDGVFAIIITVMVLDMKVPAGADFADLAGVWPVFLCYVLSFLYVGIYWNNHHHMLQAARAVTGGMLWANLHLLFWLSLFPFATGWMGENRFAQAPTELYGGVLLAAAIAYWILQGTIIRAQGEGSLLGRAVGRDWKGKLSPVLYVLGLLAGHAVVWLALAVYVGVALLWLVPDRRIERIVARPRAAAD